MNNLELNKIYNESNLDTMAKMPDDFVDIVVTSPPYNLGNKGIKTKNIKKEYDAYSDDLNIQQYFKNTKQWIDELLRVTKHHIFWNIQEVSNNKGIIAFIMNEYKDDIKEVFIWAKPNPPPHIVPTIVSSSYEYIFCISKDNPKSRKFNHCNFSHRESRGVSNLIIKPVNSGKENGGHSYAFGDWLPNHFINYFSNENDIVYDPFMGSGTTAKSAHIFNRRWIGSEISKEYVKIANKRLKIYLNQETLF
tara:strand:+ start:284 stop:1030 length:747 start_codon:yes stop_codon:yes gene_type:complete